MIRKALRYSMLSLASLATASVGFTGIASAASIGLTGPGSTNIITSRYGSGGDIHLTGPDSTNVIRSNSYGGYGGHTSGWGGYSMNADYTQNHQPRCEERYSYQWNSHEQWQQQCCPSYSSNDWDNWDNYNNNCQQSGHQYCNTQALYNRGSSDYRPVSYHVNYPSYGSDNHSYDNHYDRQHNNNHDRDYSYNRHDNDNYNRHNGGGYDNNRSYTSSNNTEVRNNNDVSVRNNTSQNAYSGNVSASHNTEVGNVASGDASNYSDTHTAVAVDNSNSYPVATAHHESGSMDSIGTTGPWSRNQVYRSTSNDYSVTNNNDVSVSNNTSQTARSGNVSVSHNTSVGDVYSGDAVNESSVSTNVMIRN